MTEPHVTRNYFTDGGDRLVIGGSLTVVEGATVEGLPGSTPAENQADSTAATVAALKDDFNALLAKLKAAGLMAADSTETAENTEV